MDNLLNLAEIGCDQHREAGAISLKGHGLQTSNEVHIGTDSHLFLSGGAHGVFDYFTGRKAPGKNSALNFRENLAERSLFCKETGRHFLQVVFPEKCVAMKSHVAISDPISSLYIRCYNDSLNERLRDFIFYPLDLLENNAEAFAKTDTHYSQRGSLTVVKGLLRSLRLNLVDLLSASTEHAFRTEPNFSGDLGRKFDPPISETIDLLARRPVPIRMGTNGIQGGNDGICVLVESPQAATDDTLLIFGDSFFRQMLPFLAIAYKRIVFCRTRFFHYEIVEAVAPNTILCGMAERYLSNCSPDLARPHFFSYPLLSIRGMQPDDTFAELWPKFFAQERLIQ